MGKNTSILRITLLSIILLSGMGFAFEDAFAAGPPYTFDFQFGFTDTDPNSIGGFVDPLGLTADDSWIYVAHSANVNRGVSIYDLDGVFQLRIPYEGFSTPNGAPVDVGVDANGFIFVVDQTGNRIHIYEAFDGVNAPALLATFGSAGSGDGQFSNPTSVAFDSSNRIYIGDGSNRRVLIFAEFNGVDAPLFSEEFGSSAFDDPPGVFNFPNGIILDSLDRVIVADRDGNNIDIFSAYDGVTPPANLTAFGTGGTGDGQFSAPTDVAVDSLDNILVADQDNGRFQVFSAYDGVNPPTFLVKEGFVGSGDAPGEFATPMGIAVDDTDRVLMSDSFASERRVQVYTSSQGPTFVGSFEPQNWTAGSFSDCTSTANLSNSNPTAFAEFVATCSTSIEPTSGPTASVDLNYNVNLGWAPDNTAVPPDADTDADVRGLGVSLRTVDFTVVAPQTGEVSFDYKYTGFHAYAGVTVKVFAIVDGTPVSPDLVNTSQISCCTFPSGGFGSVLHVLDPTFTGTAVIPVTAGQTFGLRAGGQNGDSESQIFGTVTLTNFEFTPAPLVVNGDMETPQFPGRINVFDVTLGSFAGWEEITSHLIEVHVADSLAIPTSGTQYIEIDTDPFDPNTPTFHSAPQGDQIQQTITTVPGQQYILSFDLRDRFDVNPDPGVLVHWDGAVIGTFNANTNNTDLTDWAHFDIPVTASSSSTVLGFQDDGPDDGLSALIDTVSLTVANGWVGGPTGVWSDLNNWSNGVPTGSDDIIIDGNVIVTLDIPFILTTGTLTIQNGSELIIGTGGSLTNESTNTIIINGQLTINSGQTLTNSATGTITISNKESSPALPDI